eukprot:6111874-Prymnesium_polylepis.2
MCAFVRLNCRARRDHRETVAKLPWCDARTVQYRARRNALCVPLPPESVFWAEEGPLRRCNGTSNGGAGPTYPRAMRGPKTVLCVFHEPGWLAVWVGLEHLDDQLLPYIRTARTAAAVATRGARCPGGAERA